MHLSVGWSEIGSLFFWSSEMKFHSFQDNFQWVASAKVWVTTLTWGRTLLRSRGRYSVYEDFLSESTPILDIPIQGLKCVNPRCTPMQNPFQTMVPSVFWDGAEIHRGRYSKWRTLLGYCDGRISSQNQHLAKNYFRSLFCQRSDVCE